MNFRQKIQKYIDDEDTDFVVWANKSGLQGFADVIAKHARKCDKTITPCLNGYKVCVYFFRK